MKIEDIKLTIGSYQIIPPSTDLRPTDEKLVDGLLNIFSDPLIIKFNDNYELKTKFEAEERIYNIVLAYQQRLSFTYLLFDLEKDKLIGTIELLPPFRVHTFYEKISKYCFSTGNAIRNNIWNIEYYLNQEYWKKGIMIQFVSAITEKVFLNGGKCLTALCDDQNLGSVKLLSKLNFIKKIKYNDKRNQSLWIKKLAKARLTPFYIFPCRPNNIVNKIRSADS
mgnify:CR=1 FL=1